MDYFQKKISEQKDLLYLDYLHLLTQNNTDLKSDLDRIINIEYDKNYNPVIPNYLTIFIKNFYEIVDIDYHHNYLKSNDELDFKSYVHYNPIQDKINEIKIKRQEKLNRLNYANGVKNYSIIIFDYFPIELVKQIIQIFIDNCVYNDIIYVEIKKYLWVYWNEEKISDITNQITSILINTANLSKDEYVKILNDYIPGTDQKKYSKYYLFWLYFFYPLIPGYEELVIKLVNLVYLNDAQDELMDGISRIESNELLPFYKKFIVGVWKSSNVYGTICFDLFGGGTGSFSQNVRVIKKLKEDLNWDIFSDPDLQEFWIDPDNSLSIEHIKRDLEENEENEENKNTYNDEYDYLLDNNLLDIKYIELNLDYN
jgi:hypothetical protein